MGRGGGRWGKEREHEKGSKGRERGGEKMGRCGRGKEGVDGFISSPAPSQYSSKLVEVHILPLNLHCRSHQGQFLLGL